MSEKWIKKAVNPEHEGYCTPMTKKTCTPRRKALAKRFKQMAKECLEKVPPLTESEQHELLGEAMFVCTIREKFGARRVNVEAPDREGAIQVCIRKTGKRPSDVQPASGDTDAPAAKINPHTASSPQSPWEPQALGKLKMKK